VSPQMSFRNSVAVLVVAALAGCSSSPLRGRAAVERPPELLVRPAGRTFLEVEVLYGPDTGNR